MAFLKPKFKFGASATTNSALDESEHQRNQELTRLYTSTRAGKHFQKDIVKGIGDFVSLGHKQSETSTKLAEDCKKYGSDGPSVREKLSKATVQYRVAKSKMEKERENLHRALTTLVAEPLKSMANGSPLKDARTLKEKYDRLRQEVEAQGNEVTKRKAKEGNPEQVARVQAAEQKLEEITGAMDAMGKNALAAMSLVESQQQHINLQKILAMVEYERAYFQRVTGILDQLHCEIEAQVNSTSQLAHPAPATPPQPTPLTASRKSTPQQQPVPSHTSRKSTPQQQKTTQIAAVEDDLYESKNDRYEEKEDRYEENHHYNTDEAEEEAPGPCPVGDDSNRGFYAIATSDFEGEDVGELTIAIGDEVLVRQVSESGWSEGLCNGRSGWFPSTYVKKQASGRMGGAGGSRSGSSHRQSGIAE